jgi:hypothetical protein
VEFSRYTPRLIGYRKRAQFNHGVKGLIKKAAVDYAAACGEYQIGYSVIWVNELIVQVYRTKVVLPYLNWKEKINYFLEILQLPHL